MTGTEILEVMLLLDARLARPAAGWKLEVRAKMCDTRRGVPSGSRRIDQGTVFESPALLPGDLFINYRNCETEFAFRLSSDIAGVQPIFRSRGN